MRLSMCANRESEICKYKGRPKSNLRQKIAKSGAYFLKREAAVFTTAASRSIVNKKQAKYCLLLVLLYQPTCADSSFEGRSAVVLFRK